mgnify:CR=1 FL=1
MNEDSKKNNIFKNIQLFITKNLISIIISLGVLFICFISFQIYNYYSTQQIKNNSILFFNSIDDNDEIIENLINLENNDTIFSILSTLKFIQNSKAFSLISSSKKFNSTFNYKLKYNLEKIINFKIK